MTKTVRLFLDNGDQCVDLPDEFRFNAEHVFIRRDPVSGGIILSTEDREGVEPPTAPSSPQDWTAA